MILIGGGMLAEMKMEAGAEAEADVEAGTKTPDHIGNLLKSLMIGTGQITTAEHRHRHPAAAVAKLTTAERRLHLHLHPAAAVAKLTGLRRPRRRQTTHLPPHPQPQPQPQHKLQPQPKLQIQPLEGILLQQPFQQGEMRRKRRT